MGHLKIVSVKSLGKYKIYVEFNDGTKGEVDLINLAGKGVFKKWEEDDNFNQVFIHEEFECISWPGELDIDTINIYCTIKKITPEEFFIHKNEYAPD
ncbi:MAG TPA: DUF2442 domain-containing protein [Chitinophagaceae bacterium]|jgi:Protein of unknown function (DUF2442).